MKNQQTLQDRILLGILREFEKSFNIKDTESKSFEKLVNYIIFSKIDTEAFSDPATFSMIDVDKNSSFGIDAFGMFVNGKLIHSTEQLAEMRQSGRMEVKFIFVQTKKSTNIESGDLLKFSKAVSNFLSHTPTIPLSEELEEAKQLLEEVYQREYTKLFKGQKPSCELYFATAGEECNDNFIKTLMDSEKNDMQNKNQDVRFDKFEHIHKEYIIDGFNEIENTYHAIINFNNSVTCAQIDDVEQAYIGYLSVSEFLKIITGARDGLLLKNIFYENVRDFQGSDKGVNLEIAHTLANESQHDKFILLNNGVTIVAKSFQNLRSSDYEISTYFIVNGCQTSTSIYNHKETLKNSALQVPVKIIHTQNEKLISQIIRSTNRQTPVPDEAFVSLGKFHKRLQDFYKIFSQEAPHALYYERRSREFSGSELIEKRRVINLHSQIRTFSAIILNEPHLPSTRNPSSILKSLSAKIFKENHNYTAYYVSSQLLFVFYQAKDNGDIDGKYEISRYWICWIARILALGCKANIETKLNSPEFNSDLTKFSRKLGDNLYVKELFCQSAIIFEKVKNTQNRVDGHLPKNKDLIKSKDFKNDIMRFIQEQPHAKNAAHSLSNNFPDK